MLKKSKLNLYSIVLSMIVIGFFSSFIYAHAATINLSPSSGSYRVGDTIRIKVTISSDISVNAVSGRVSFPTNLLSLSSLSKSGSIISLWAQEPSYSNSSGSASFEGVILNGYNGSGATVLTLVFKAKSIGTANLAFTSGSILANDGDGTEVISGNGSSTLNIREALPQTEIKKEEVKIQAPEKEKSDTIKIIQVNTVTTNYSWKFFIIILIALLIVLITLVIMYEIYYIDKLEKSVKDKLIDIEQDITRDFSTLAQDAGKDNKVYSEIKSTGDEVVKEIQDFEKEL